MGEPVARSPVAEQDRGGRARARSRRWRASSRASTSCRVPPHCSSHGNSRGSGCPPPGPLRPRPIRRASCPARSTPHPSSRVSIHLCFRSRQAPVLAWRLPAVGERGPQIERGGRGIFGKRRRRMPSPAADPGSPMAECRHPAPAWSSHRSSLRSTRPPRHPGRFRVAGCGGAYGGPFGRWPRMSGVACAFPRQGSPARRPATGASPGTRDGARARGTAEMRANSTLCARQLPDECVAWPNSSLDIRSNRGFLDAGAGGAPGRRRDALDLVRGLSESGPEAGGSRVSPPVPPGS